MSDTDRGAILLAIARASIGQALGHARRVDDSVPWLHEPGASFVTLMQNGRLRGCIGSLEARQALRTDVRDNALGAAFRDPRFTPLTVGELEHTAIEVSLLSPMERLIFTSEAQALNDLRPGIDGVVFEYGAHRSTFLPQVWEQLPDQRDFIAHLKQKAGLPAHFWSDEVRLQRYTVSKWKERP